MSKAIERRLGKLVDKELGVGSPVDAALFVCTERSSFQETFTILGFGFVGGAMGTFIGSLFGRDKNRGAPAVPVVIPTSGLGALARTTRWLIAVVGPEIMAWDETDNSFICRFGIDELTAVSLRKSKVTPTALVVRLTDPSSEVELHGLHGDAQRFAFLVATRAGLMLRGP